MGGAYLALEPITRFVLVLFALATLFSSEPGRGREYTTAATRAARLTVRDALASL